MKIYLAGPMTGYSEFNFPKFRTAAYTLRREGHEVFSPHEADEETYGSELFKDTTGNEPVVDPRHVIKVDCNYIIDHAEAIALLPGWEYSPGCQVEFSLAKFLKLKFIYL